LVSWRHITSGWCCASHSRTRGRRLRIEFTFQVAIFITDAARAGGVHCRMIAPTRDVMDPNLPEGFVLKPDFLDPDEERALIDFIRTLPFGAVRMHGITAKRRVAQFGWHYSFESYRLTPAAAIPPEIEAVRRRAAALAQIEPAEFSEALITEYPAGA